jgi:hypothetical protein
MPPAPSRLTGLNDQGQRSCEAAPAVVGDVMGRAGRLLSSAPVQRVKRPIYLDRLEGW